MDVSLTIDVETAKLQCRQIMTTGSQYVILVSDWEDSVGADGVLFVSDKNNSELASCVLVNGTGTLSLADDRVMAYVSKNMRPGTVFQAFGTVWSLTHAASVAIGSIQIAVCSIITDPSAPTTPTTYKGAKGDAGNDGASAYQIWLANGNVGTEAQFLASLKGADGRDGADGTNGINGNNGLNGATGATGASAYQIWLANGNVGTEAQFLASLKGADGKNGVDGRDGADGANGAAGPSAYEIWLANGNVGTVTQFLASLKGSSGANGIIGSKGEKGDRGEAGAGFTAGALSIIGALPDPATIDPDNITERQTVEMLTLVITALKGGLQ